MRSKMEKWYEDKTGHPGTIDQQVDLVVHYYNEYRKGRDPDLSGHDHSQDDDGEEEITDDDIIDDTAPRPQHFSFKDKVMAWSAATDVEDIIDIVDTVTVQELKTYGAKAPTKFLKDIEEYSDLPAVASMARKLQVAAVPNAPRLIRTLVKGGIPGRSVQRVDNHTVHVDFPNHYQFRLDTKAMTALLGVLDADGGFDQERKFKLTDRFVDDLIAAYKARQ